MVRYLMKIHQNPSWPPLAAMVLGLVGWIAGLIGCIHRHPAADIRKRHQRGYARSCLVRL